MLKLGSHCCLRLCAYASLQIRADSLVRSSDTAIAGLSCIFAARLRLMAALVHRARGPHEIASYLRRQAERAAHYRSARVVYHLPSSFTRSRGTDQTRSVPLSSPSRLLSYRSRVSWYVLLRVIIFRVSRHSDSVLSSVTRCAFVKGDILTGPET